MNITQYSENTVTVYLGNEIDEDLNRQLVQLKIFWMIKVLMVSKKLLYLTLV
jgi:hypothetical protein